MSNIGSFFNLGSQTTLVNQTNGRLRLKINPSQSTDVSFVFPANEGDASGYVLATDGSGTTSWIAQSGGSSTNPGGDQYAIQFNGDASDFSGVSNLTFNSTTNVLSVNGDISTNTLVVDGTSTLGGVLTVNADSNLNNVYISKGTDASNATLTLDNSSSLVMTPIVYENVVDFSGQDLEPVSSILIFDFSNNENIDCSLNNASQSYFQEGQHLSIFYLNRNPTGSLRIDFGDSNIVTGNGANRYLTFNSFGQSAELLAYGTGGATSNRYLVFNTGASPSS